MAEVIHKAEEVFGIGRDLPLNYVQREKVDSPFFESLSRDKHIVVYGSSKQGKTSLRKSWLSDSDHLLVGCLSTMSLHQLHGAILKRAGFRVEQSQARAVDGGYKFTAELKGKGKVPFVAELSGGGGAEKSHSETDTSTTKRLELDLGDVNDVIAALDESEAPKHIVLEDFHYLSVETQSNFSIALKAFHESSKYCFIVIGVWREKNRLIYFNGDLTSRVVAIDADAWSADEQRAVIQAGEPLLNVSFDEAFVESVISNAHDAIYLVQEACLKAVHGAGVYQTTDDNKIVGCKVDAKDLIKSIVDEQAGRYIAFLNNVAEGFQKAELEMYKWLLHAVLRTPLNDLHNGVRRSTIAAAIKVHHPQGDGLNEGNITQALTSIASLQVKKNIRPIILDYDQTNRVLNVVDRAFLVWLAYQDIDELAAQIA